MEKLKEIISASENIVFFGGAGTATESGIPDFRSEAGLYKTSNGYSYPPEVMLSHTFFMNHTEEFYKFYREKMLYLDAKPNVAHYALTELEKKKKLKAILTQNIDGLHQAADSQNVLEIHGSAHRNYCMSCGERFGLDYIAGSASLIPKCSKCGGTIRPDVVLYEEGLDMEVWQKAIDFVSKADVFIIGGTSLIVYPAASLVNHYRGNKLILINKSTTPCDRDAALVFHESIGKVLSQCVTEI